MAAQIEVGEEVFQRFEIEGRDRELIGLSCRVDPVVQATTDWIAERIRFWASKDPTGPDHDVDWTMLGGSGPF